jgi:molecular chaperone GrpE
MTDQNKQSLDEEKIEPEVDDVVFEEENNETPESSFGKNKDSKLGKLEAELEKCRAERQEFLDGWQRSKADYINLKKRNDQDRENITSYAKEDLILEMIKIGDNFQLAFKDKEAWEKAPENWRRGIEYIYNNLKQVLADQGVVEINPIGEEFNPEQHDAVETIETDDAAQDHKIVEVVQLGYSLKDRVIRHATVKVGKLKEK